MPQQQNHSESASVLVSNLVRPFVESQVKELLSKNGTLTSFWLHPLKTHCYATVKAKG